MRMIGHLGSQLDASDPAGSAQKLATMFMAGLVAPAAAAINQILQLVNDPNLIPNLIQRGIAFAKALAAAAVLARRPPSRRTATDLVNAVTNVINLVTSRAWAAIPAAITTIATTASAVASGLSQMKDKTTTINVSGFGPVGSDSPHPAPTSATWPPRSSTPSASPPAGSAPSPPGCSAPRSHSSPRPPSRSPQALRRLHPRRLSRELRHHPLDRSGHTGTQIVQRYFVNQIHKLV